MDTDKDGDMNMEGGNGATLEAWRARETHVAPVGQGQAAGTGGPGSLPLPTMGTMESGTCMAVPVVGAGLARGSNSGASDAPSQGSLQGKNAVAGAALPPRLGGLGLSPGSGGRHQMIPAAHAEALAGNAGTGVMAGQGHLGAAHPAAAPPQGQAGTAGRKEVASNLANLIVQRQRQYQDIIQRGGKLTQPQMVELQQLILAFQRVHGTTTNVNPFNAVNQFVSDQAAKKRAATGAPLQIGQTSASDHGRVADIVLMQNAVVYAKQAYQQLVASGEINAQRITPEEKKKVLDRLAREALQRHTRQRASHGRHAHVRADTTQAGPLKNKAMRVSIDKRRRGNASATFNAEDTTKGDHTQEVLNRVSEITEHLRNELTNKSRLGGAQRFDQVTQQMLIDACGGNARFLKGYQMIGINFLMLLYRTQVGGAILADEMGLGKTCQIISYLGAIAALEHDEGPHLVVVPASLLENWQRELDRWCPKLKSIVYYGKHRGVIRKRLRDLKTKMDAGIEVDDDLADLQDEDILADLAMSDKLEAERMSDESEDDALNADQEAGHESDQDFDVRAEREGAPASGKPKVSVPPPTKWDYAKGLPKAPFNVLLTSYTLFERDSNEQRKDREFLESWTWSHIIMDEAHALKNKEAQRTTRLRRVAAVSRRRIMMTGTPLQNDLFELQNLMQFLLPQVFASKAEAFGDFVEMANDEEEVEKLTDRMKQLLGPFVLRRLKTEVAGQLTPKQHTTKFIDMSPVQGELYQASVDHMKSQINSQIKTPAASSCTQGGDETTLKKFISCIGAKKISHLFSYLRKIAQHPLLVRSNYSDADVAAIAKKAVDHGLFSGDVTLKKVSDELSSYSDYGIHAFCYGAGPDFAMHKLTTEHMMASCKFRFLSELLPKLKEAGSRPLIFSQWTSMLDIIEWLMDFLQLPYVRLDGSTAVDERLATVDRFNNGTDDVFAFLLSTRAGGQGLNLTGADTVILHDVDFNPQIDRQAEDRCHRLGQTKPVSVYRLITKATVDQNIFGMSLRKLKLDHAVLDGITSGAGARNKQNAQERQHMGNILRQLFNGEEKYDEMAEQVEKMETEENEANKLALPRDPTAHGSVAEDSKVAEKLKADTPAVPEGVGAAAVPSDIKKGKRG